MRYALKIGLLATATLLTVLVLASAVYGAPPASDPVTVNVTVEDFISITNPGDVTLANITGTGGSSEASATWQVVTNNDNGYKLEISAGGTPALSKGADSFADYSGPGAWSIAASESAFGFSVGNNTSYQGLTGGTPIQIRSTPGETAGEDTTVYFKAEVGSSHLQASGSYAANLTVTATTL